MKKIAILVYIIFIISGCSGNKKEFTAESIEVEMAKNPTSLGGHNIFYIDPLDGDIDNDGSIDAPWDTLEHVLKKGYVKTKSYNGSVLNEFGVIEAGDIVKLRTGYHGKIYYRNSYNEQPIVFEADEGHKPTLSRLTINSAENLVFKGLTISPTFDENDFGGGQIVTFCTNKWFGVCNNMTLMDSFIYSSLDASSWNRDDWLTKSSSGISVSRGSTNFKFINNYILNVRNGITVSSPGTLIDSNVVSGYFKNGLNVNADQTIVTKNVVKNSLGIRSGATFAIRGYKGASGIKNVAIQDNIFLSDYNNVSNFSNAGYGIVFYDGPIDSFFIDNNVVGVKGVNGIVLYDSISSEIKNNVVYNVDEDDTNVVTALRLGSKGKLVPNENVFEGNEVNSFIVSIDENVTDIFNNDASRNGFNSKFSDVANTIFNSYGNEHLISQLQKIDSVLIDTYRVTSKSTDTSTDTSTAVGSNHILSATLDPILISAKAEPSIFYVDPVYGNIENSGSKSSPWSTLEAVLKKGYIETKDKNGVVRFSGAPVKAGDIIKLKSGYHGSIYYRNSYNDELITIEADDGETPKLSHLEVHSATNILFKGLTISPSFSSSSTGGIVKLCFNGWFGKCDNISVVDSYIYTVDDASAWSKEDWTSKAVVGIGIGPKGAQFNIINNMIRNINFGITVAAPNSHVSGNVVDNFTGDGIRVAANNSTVQFNVIKNNLNVNANHDDGIQGYQGNVGGNDDLIINNIIISSDVERPAFPGELQGIGYFDGLSSRLSVIGNAIDVNAYHGISLYDVEASLIAENVTITTEPLENGAAACWVMIGTKGKGGSTGNEVISNFSNSFELSDNIDGVDENNLTVSLVDYADKFIRILNEINLRYGAGSSLANLPRVSDFYKNKIGAN